MSDCRHPAIPGAALIAVCGACGSAYDVAPPAWMATKQRRTGRRRPAPRPAPEPGQAPGSIFTRSSVMEAPPKPRAPRRPTQEQECRAEYERYILALFDKAMEETNGVFLLVDARQRGCKYSTWQLFTARKNIIGKWGSDELVTFFSYNRRLSYADFRLQWRQATTDTKGELAHADNL